MTRAYRCVVDSEACPSISWIARRSAPDSSRWVAKECRIPWGDRWRPIAPTRASSRSRRILATLRGEIPRPDSFPTFPRRLRKTGSSSPLRNSPPCAGGRTARYFPSARTAFPPTGTTRTFLPFPVTRTVDDSMERSRIRREQSSPTRSPEEYSSSRIAASRFSRRVPQGRPRRKASISSTGRNSGSRIALRGAGIPTAGLASISPCATRNPRKVLTADTLRAAVAGRIFSPVSPRAASNCREKNRRRSAAVTFDQSTGSAPPRSRLPAGTAGGVPLPSGTRARFPPKRSARPQETP